jgi:hypothetical protein
VFPDNKYGRRSLRGKKQIQVKSVLWKMIVEDAYTWKYLVNSVGRTSRSLIDYYITAGELSYNKTLAW